MQDRNASTHYWPVRVSLFLINSYLARLLIGILAITWIIMGAAINMAACDVQQVTVCLGLKAGQKIAVYMYLYLWLHQHLLLCILNYT